MVVVNGLVVTCYLINWILIILWHREWMACRLGFRDCLFWGRLGFRGLFRVRHSTIGICLGDINSIFWRLFNGYQDTFCTELGFVI
jgi:hypothetical protein